MNSQDIRIVINGQEFRVEGSVLRPASQSNFQQEVLKRLDGIESRLGNVESRLVVVEQEQRLLHVKVDDLQTSVYWVLGAIAIFLAAIQLWPNKKDSDSSSRNQPIVVQMPPIYPYPYDPRKPDEKSA